MGLDMYLHKINKVAKNGDEINDLLSSKKLAPSKEEIEAYHLLLNDKPFEAFAIVEPWNKVDINNFKYAEETKELKYGGTGIFIGDYFSKVSESIKRLHTNLIPKVAEYIKCEDENKYIERNEIMYWRKHPDLHGYMEKVYEEKGGDKIFNCEYLVLNKEDVEKLISQLEKHISGKDSSIQTTTGFFFGQTDPEQFKEDIEVFNEVLRDTDWGNETIAYYSWW